MDLRNYDLPNEYLSDKNRVFVEIFKQHFGEDRVSAIMSSGGMKELSSFMKVREDMITEEKMHEYFSKPNARKLSDISVIVHYPQATVENERGDTEHIENLFVKIIPYHGDTIYAIKTSFTSSQLSSGYVHSHIPRCYETPAWEAWCLGSGPIRHTLNALYRNEDSDPGMIGLLCMELDTLVSTESLHGGPYIRMEELHNGVKYMFHPMASFTQNYIYEDLEFHSVALREWGKEFFSSGKIKLKLDNGFIKLAESPMDFLIDATNDFIEYLAKHNIPISSFMQRDRYTVEKFYEFIIENGELKVVNRGSTGSRMNSHLGETLVTFKGVDYKMKLIDAPMKSESHSIWLICPELLLRYLSCFLMYLNDRYVKSK